MGLAARSNGKVRENTKVHQVISRCVRF